MLAIPPTFANALPKIVASAPTSYVETRGIDTFLSQDG